MLREANAAIESDLDLETLFRRLYRSLSTVVDTTGFIFGLYDEPSQTVTVVRQMDSGRELSGGSFPLGSGFTSQVLRSGESVLIRRWSEEGPRVQVQYATDRAGLPESGITVPARLGARVVGFLSVQSYRPEAYETEDLVLLEAIATSVALAIERRRHSAPVDLEFQRRLSELEAILSAMSDALLYVDADGRLVRLNRAARQLLGVDNTEAEGIILGQPLDRERWSQWPLGPREIAERIAPIIDALRRGEPTREQEIELQGVGRRVLSFSAAPLQDASGAVHGGVIAFRDVTERRVIEDLKDEVLAIASHDLKSPLTVITGHLGMLKRRVERGLLSPEDVIGELDTIARESDRLVNMLDSLLDFSQIEAGRLKLNREPVDLVRLVDEILEGFRSTSEQHTFVLTAPPEVPGEWDSRRLEQVLGNLLSNAVKYSPNGGTIRICIERTDGVRVSVRDEGIGIEPDAIDHVFDRFFRAQGARRLQGSGLGLYICRGIVAAHGGRIWAESDGPKTGARFTFTLPEAPADVERR